MKYEGVRATVMGLGLFGGGVAAARWLARSGARVTVTDTATEQQLAGSLQRLRAEPIDRYVLGAHREADFRSADLVVVNPAVRPDNPWLEFAGARGAKLTSEIELLLENCPAPIAAVTGSNGKSTTAAMLARILATGGRRVHLGGNIGRSLLDQLGSIAPADWVVLELSSFQLHHLSRETEMPPTAVVTNLSPNHLNWHPHVEHYAAAKQRLLREQSGGGTAVFDPSSHGLQGWEKIVRGTHLVPRSRNDLPPLLVPGKHNRENAALAAEAARSVGCRDADIESGLTGFGGLIDRLETVKVIGKQRFVNDSSSTTPESTIAALRSFEGPVWLLAGGADKGGDYDSLARRIAEHAAGAVFFGQVASRLAEMVASHGSGTSCAVAESLEQAFHLCLATAPADATILFSPGCSSHDQFANYRSRATAFVTLVGSHCTDSRRRPLQLPG